MTLQHYLYICLFLLYSCFLFSCKESSSIIPSLPSKLPPKDTLVYKDALSFQFIQTHLSPNQQSDITNNLYQQYTTIKQWLSLNDSTTINFIIYPSIEQKALATESDEIAQYTPQQQTISLVENNHFKGHQEGTTALPLLRKKLQSPHFIALETGLRIYLSAQWQKNLHTTSWAKKLLASNNLPSLSTLLNNQAFQQGSPILNGIASASFVDFMIKNKSKELFLTQYNNPSINYFISLETEWHNYLQSTTPRHTTSTPTPLQQLKGYNFAHEGYGIYNGYGSTLAQQSLDTLFDWGINSIALIPYSYMRNANTPSQLPIMQRAGSETDEATISSHYYAKQQGKTTILKPQIWLHNSWPGDIRMSSEEDWQLFFQYYHDWIIHYALLAQIHQFDAFCIGVEFRYATLERPDDWRQLIQQIRAIYDGPLIYAANWGEEFEQLTFWEDLDYIGINCYYPLSQEKKPNINTLTKNFESITKKIRKTSQQYNRPVIFTEIGFRSIPTPWVLPHASPQSKDYNEKSQADCYQAVLHTLQDKDWCKGILWWKWPSYLNYQGKNNTGYTPYNKEVEKVIKAYYSH